MRTLLTSFVSLIFLSVARLPAHDGLHSALESNRHALEEAPDDPANHLERASLLIGHGKAEQAIESIQIARQHGADPLVCAMLLAKVQFAGDQAESAIATLAPILSEFPDHLPALRLHSRALASLDRTREALADCRRLLELEADPDDAFFAAGLLVSDSRSAEAVELLDQSFPIEKRPASITRRAFEIETDMGNWDAALLRLDQQIALAKRPEPLLALKADTYTAAGRPEEALATWSTLDQSLSGLPPTLRQSASMSRLAQRSHKALSTLNK